MAIKPVRVFVDSNVVLSGLLSEKGAPRILLDLLSLNLPFLTGLTGRYNLIEIERNLSKKFPRIDSLYRRYFPKLNLKIIPLPHPHEIEAFRGQIADKDIPVLLSAIKGKADFLITGDIRHFEKLRGFRKYPLTLATPAEFVDRILPDIVRKLEAEVK